MKGRSFSICLLAIALAVFFSGLWWLSKLRFESGDVYPRGSSFRADPQGTKALFEAYAAISGIEAERNFAPFDQMDALPTDATVFFINTKGYNLHRLALHDTLFHFVAQGGRLVAALNSDEVSYKYIEQERLEDSVDEKKNRESEEASNDFFKREAFEEKERRIWADLTLKYGKHRGGFAMRAHDGDTILPETLPWREGGVVDNLGKVWKPVYTIEEEVVAVERQLGRGSVVVLTDDFLFTNEALLQQRYSGFLAWAAGNSSRVVFDETHLGVASRSGVAMLLRRYRLEYFFMGLLVCLLLAIWRGSNPLLPARTSLSQTNTVQLEHSSEAGLGDLIRRGISVQDLPGTAYRNWKKSFIRNEADAHFYKKELEDVDAILADYHSRPSRERKPRETHLKIQSIINRKTKKQL